MGTVGLNWQFSGVGNLSGVAGETDLQLRNSSTSALEVYHIKNNQLGGYRATRWPSLRAMMRKSSCLISCGQWLPDGSLWFWSERTAR